MRYQAHKLVQCQGHKLTQSFCLPCSVPHYTDAYSSLRWRPVVGRITFTSLPHTLDLVQANTVYSLLCTKQNLVHCPVFLFCIGMNFKLVHPDKRQQPMDRLKTRGWEVSSLHVCEVRLT